MVDGDDVVRGLAVRVEDGEVEVGLDEVVVGDVVGELPAAHGVQFVGVAGAQLEVVAGVDVDKDVARLVAAVILDVVLDAVGFEGAVERGVEGEVGTVLDFLFHGEDAGAGEAALHGRAEVVGLIKGQAVLQLALAVYDGVGLRLDAREVDVVAELDVKLEACLFGHCDGHQVRLGDGAADVDAGGEGARGVEVDVTLGLVGGGGDEGCQKAVAVEGEDALAAGGVAVAEGDGMTAAVAAGHLDVDGVVGAVDPVVFVVVAVAGIEGIGEDGKLLLGGGVGDIHLDSAGDVAALAVAGEDVYARGDVEAVFKAGGGACLYRGAGGLVDQRHCGRIAVHLYLHRVGL